MVFGRSLGPIPTPKQYGGALQHAKYIIKLAGMKGYEKPGCKLRNYEKSRLQYDLVQAEEPGHRLEGIRRSLVASLPRGRRITQLINRLITQLLMVRGSRFMRP